MKKRLLTLIIMLVSFVTLWATEEINVTSESFGGGTNYNTNEVICMKYSAANEEYFLLIQNQKLYYWCFRDGIQFDKSGYEIKAPKKQMGYEIIDYYLTDSKTEFRLDEEQVFNFSINTNIKADDSSVTILTKDELKAHVDVENLPALKDANIIVTYKKEFQNKIGNVYKFENDDRTSFYYIVDEKYIYEPTKKTDGFTYGIERLAYYDSENGSGSEGYSMYQFSDLNYGIGSYYKKGLFNKVNIYVYFVFEVNEKDFKPYKVEKSSLEELESTIPDYQEHLQNFKYR